MKSIKIVAAVVMATAATMAVALPSFVKDFASIYKLEKTSTLAKATCAVCHIGKSTKLNLYGLDIKKELAAAKTKKITAELLKKVEELDSDKDGVKNIDEIKADTLPGDPASIPAKK